jgi:hypothetical protein
MILSPGTLFYGARWLLVLWSSLYSLSTDCEENTTSNSYVVACVFDVMGTCLRSPCIAMNISSGSVMLALMRQVSLLPFYGFSSKVPHRQAKISSVTMGPTCDVYDWLHKHHLNVMLAPPLILPLLKTTNLQSLWVGSRAAVSELLPP